jgi:adenylosuccinate synthase
VVEGLSQLVDAVEQGPVVIDSVRTGDQIEHLRQLYGSRARHVHVSATPSVCETRFGKRQRELDRGTDYATVASDPTEAAVRELEGFADIAVRTDRLAANDSIVLAAAQLGLFDREHHACVDVVIGGSYGSEGKGNIAFYLAPEYDYLVRVGGPNAAHKVYPDGAAKPYTHYSLPSGTLASQAHLILGPGAVVDPQMLLQEIEECGVTPERLSIDPRVMIITDADKEREAALKGAIGSTASGTGSATARRLMRQSDVKLAVENKDLQPYVRRTFDVLESAYADGKRIMLEGTQGSGLSLFHGPYPFVTSRDTNVAGCLAEAGIAPNRVRRTILVVRTYPIRVAGNSGPITRELDWDELERRTGLVGLAEKERTSRTGNIRRVGEPEWDLLRTSAVLNAPTDVALTFADYFAGNDEAWRYEQLSQEAIEFIDQVEGVTGARVSLISTGFMAHRGIIDRRQW